MKRILIGLMGLLLTLSAQAQSFADEDDHAILGTPGQRLIMSKLIDVPLAAIAPWQYKRNGYVVTTIFMKDGVVLVDQRDSRDTLLKSFETLLTEKQNNFCALNIVVETENPHRIQLRTFLDLNYIAQGGKWGGQGMIYVHRTVGDPKVSPGMNEAISIKCYTFRQTRPEIRVGDLKKALGPNVNVVRKGF